MFLKNKKNIFKIRRSKVADYAALTSTECLAHGHGTDPPVTCADPEHYARVVGF